MSSRYACKKNSFKLRKLLIAKMTTMPKIKELALKEHDLTISGYYFLFQAYS